MWIQSFQPEISKNQQIFLRSNLIYVTQIQNAETVEKYTHIYLKWEAATIKIVEKYTYICQSLAFSFKKWGKKMC